jgi:hypothetical protein
MMLTKTSISPKVTKLQESFDTCWKRTDLFFNSYFIKTFAKQTTEATEAFL